MPSVAPMTPEDFDALLRLNGLVPSLERRARLWAARSVVDTIRAGLAHNLSFAEESAVLFLPDRAVSTRQAR